MKKHNFTKLWDVQIYTPLVSLDIDLDKDLPWNAVECYNPSLEIKWKVDEILLLKDYKTEKELIKEIFPYYIKLLSFLTNFENEDVEGLQNYLKEINENFWKIKDKSDIQDPHYIRIYNGFTLLKLCIQKIKKWNVDLITLKSQYREEIKKERNRKNHLAILLQSIEKNQNAISDEKK